MARGRADEGAEIIVRVVANGRREATIASSAERFPILAVALADGNCAPKSRFRVLPMAGA
jgi:hypothetical protein